MAWDFGSCALHSQTMSGTAEELGARLVARGAWIAVAESLTAGRLQAGIARVSGASRYFAGGVTAYTLEQKVRQLGVDRAHAQEVGCVSERVAREMVRGVAERFQVAVAAATTGYAEPWGAVAEPFAHVAVLVDGVVSVAIVRAPGCDRQQAQERVVAEVIGLLVERLS